MIGVFINHFDELALIFARLKLFNCSIILY